MVKHLTGFREVEFRFRMPSGSRSQAAGIRITYTPWSELIIESKVKWPSGNDYEGAITGVIRRYISEVAESDFCGRFTIEEIMFDEVNSSQYSFMMAARQAVRAIFDLGIGNKPLLNS